jgi:hypothetical protein
MIDARDQSLPLMNYVKDLEGHSSLERGQTVQSILAAAGIKSKIQQHRYPRIKNIILDFASGSEGKSLLFSAHYDAVKGSPAANDNASGVAVLLGLCRRLQHTRAPVKIVFFDREEAWVKTPWLRLGLLGSLFYVWKTDLRNIAAVYNLEFCGAGDSLVVWPITDTQIDLPVSRRVSRVAARIKLGCHCAHIPWIFISSDHLSFRLKGLANAVTLSLLPATQLPAMETFLSELKLTSLVKGRRPPLPGILSDIHSSDDLSANLEEDSLQLMLALLLEIIRDFSSNGCE